LNEVQLTVSLLRQRFVKSTLWWKQHKTSLKY